MPEMRRVVAVCVLALALSACGNDSSPAQAQGQPRTLEAAAAAGQQWADRFTAHDFAGAWQLMSKQLRDGLSQNDYVTYNETCKRGRVPATVSGLRMDGDSTAIVQMAAGGITDSRTMVYEDGQWLMTPPEALAEQLGKPVDQIIAHDRSEGRCDG